MSRFSSAGVNRPTPSAAPGHSAKRFFSAERRLSSEFMMYGGGVIQPFRARRSDFFVVTLNMVMVLPDSGGVAWLSKPACPTYVYRSYPPVVYANAIINRIL